MDTTTTTPPVIATAKPLQPPRALVTVKEDCRRRLNSIGHNHRNWRFHYRDDVKALMAELERVEKENATLREEARGQANRQESRRSEKGK